MLLTAEARHVLHNKVTRLNGDNHPRELDYEVVSLVINLTQAAYRESLTWRSTYYHIDVARVIESLVEGDSGLHRCLHVAEVSIPNVAADDSRGREVVFVSSTMERISIKRGYDVETGLIETQRHPARASEQIDRDRPHLRSVECTFRHDCRGRIIGASLDLRTVLHRDPILPFPNPWPQRA